MLSRDRGFIFIHIPKTGGNSLQILLEPYSEDRRWSKLVQDGSDRFAVRGPITSAKHQSLATYVERLGMDLCGQMKKVTFVRDPFDRAMSYYFSPHRWLETSSREPAARTPYFDRNSFIKVASRLLPMVEYLRMDGQVAAMDFVGRFERFETDAARLLEFLGIDPQDTKLPHANRGSVDGRDDFYDDASLDFVRRRFARDFETFGYSAVGPA